MPRRIEFVEFLSHMQSRIAEPVPLPKPQLVLLEQTVEELRVAVEELRLAEEQMAASALDNQAVQQAESASAARLAGSFAAAPWPLVLTDLLGTVREANPAAAELLGVGRENLLGKPLAVYVPGEARSRFRQLLARVARGEAVEREALVLAPRATLPLEIEATAWSSGGSEPCITWSLRDVTVLRQAEDAEQERGEFLRRTLDSLPLAVAALDLDGSVLLWNEEARRLLGWSEEELSGGPNPALGDELMPVLDAVRRAGTEPRLTVALTSDAEDSRGTRRRMQVTVAPLADAEGEVRGTVAVFRPDADDALEPVAAAEAEVGSRPDWCAQELRRVLFAGAGAEVAERMRNGIAAALDLGYLRPGDRLPGAREAAVASGADHRIVSAAYRRLAAEGLVEVRPRRGAQISQLPEAAVPELPETAEWLAEVLKGAAGQQVRVAALAELVRRWTAAVPVRCLCLDSTEDGRAALVHEMTAQWGMECTALGDGRGGARDLAAAVRAADLVVTTHFSAGAARAAARTAGKPLVLAGMNPELVEALEGGLRRRALLAVVADRAFGERLRAVPGGDRLQVVPVSDADRVAVAVASGETALVTLAAQQRLQQQPRLLWAPGHFLAPLDPRTVARVLIRANLAPARAEY